MLLASSRFAIFDAFPSEAGREAHLAGPVAAALMENAPELLASDPNIETVDVLENPEAADEYRILTTPTVVREAPAPRRRVTGDLGDTAQVLAALALFPSPPKT